MSIRRNRGKGDRKKKGEQNMQKMESKNEINKIIKERR